jgi:hypothetical protein
MALQPGAHVIWIYRHRGGHGQPSRIYQIAAELVHMGRLRARIRIPLESGGTVLRWVKPQNLRPPQAGDVLDPYPE